MLIYKNKDNKITRINRIISREDAADHIDGSSCVWYEGEFSFRDGENIDGKQKEFYYENGEIRIEYVDIPEPTEYEPTQLDRMEAKTDYIMMMQGGA